MYFYGDSCAEFHGSLHLAWPPTGVALGQKTQARRLRFVLKQKAGTPRRAESFKEVVLFELDLSSWSDTSYEGGIRLRWIGDLDNDGKLDVLLTYSTHYACWDVILLLSSKAMGNRLIGEAAKYSACGC